ncbi:MAG: AraC family transcriptional regulator [Pseudomonadota bacterium]
MGIPDTLKQTFVNDCRPKCTLDEPIGLAGGLLNAQAYATLLDDFLVSGGIGGNLRAESLVTLLLGDLYRTVAKESAQREDRRLSPRAIAMLEDYIDTHLDEKIRLETLAALVNVSQFHFVRRFKATTGLPPHQFVIRHRLEKVKSYLQKSELSLAQIARCCGFSSQSHMSRLFRRYIGVAPANYRNSWWS